MKKFLLPLALMSALLASCEKPENDEPEYTISISPSVLTFGAEGGEQAVKVTINRDWWYIGDSPYWLEYQESDDSATIYVQPISSNDFTGREGILTFYARAEEASAELKIVQEGDAIIQFKDPLFLRAILEDKSADKNGDKQISIIEASLITTLNCHDAGIRVMDEIKYFTALRWLYCSNNQLTSLDVSNNTALKELSCYDNQLTSLDVSNNTALKELSCYDNQLTSLDVSKNTALTDLSCGDNQLTSLDVSKNTALTYLYCGDNQLTSLDVSKNTALTDLSCGDNQLTELNLNLNTNTVLSALTGLSCSNNQLMSLDVSNCTALISLSCRNNQLTTLDVSNNTALTDLGCDDNQLTTLDLSKNTALTSLSCGDNQLTKIILPRNHSIRDYNIQSIIEEYGNIIEYR